MRSRPVPRAPLVRAIPLALVVSLLVATAPNHAHAQEGARRARPPATTTKPAKPATQSAKPAKPAKPATKPTPKPAATPVATPVAPAPAAAPLPPDAQRAVRSVQVHEGPDGRALGTLGQRTVVTPLAREGGWVRVRLEGWVREADLEPTDTTITTQLAAADLRADPEGTKGRTVRWDVELLAFQLADPLRRDLAPEEPYLLVRGPGDENAMLYLALPPSLVQQGRGLPPLTRLQVTARVRSGRSVPAGLPVLDVLTLTPLKRG